jgi:hypothetical protein
MDIESVATQLTLYANQAYEIARASIVWSGHTAKTYYSQYAIPAAEKLSTLAVFCFKQLQKLVLAGPGKIFALAGGVLFLSITAFKIADRKAYEEDPFARTVWKTAGIAAFMSATALTSVGIFAALSI